MGAVQYFGNGTDAVARAARRLARSRRAPRGVRRKPYPRVRIFPRGTPRRGEILAFVPRADLPPLLASPSRSGQGVRRLGGGHRSESGPRRRRGVEGTRDAPPRLARRAGPARPPRRTHGGIFFYFFRPRPRPARGPRDSPPRPRRPPPAPASLTPRPVPAPLAELALVDAQEHREVLRRERRQVIRAARGSRGVPPRSWSGGDARTSVEGATRTSHRLRNAFGILQHHPPFPEFSSPTSPPPRPPPPPVRSSIDLVRDPVPPPGGAPLFPSRSLGSVLTPRRASRRPPPSRARGSPDTPPSP